MLSVALKSAPSPIVTMLSLTSTENGASSEEDPTAKSSVVSVR